MNLLPCPLILFILAFFCRNREGWIGTNIWAYSSTFPLIRSWYNLDWAQFSWLHIIHDLVSLQVFKTRYETLSHSQCNDEIIRHLFLYSHANKRSIKVYVSGCLPTNAALRRKQVRWWLLHKFSETSFIKQNVINSPSHSWW